MTTSILEIPSGGYQHAMIQGKQSTQKLLHLIRQEYMKDESGRLGQLARLLDEQLCAGDPLPQDWQYIDPHPRPVTIRIVDNYL